MTDESTEPAAAPAPLQIKVSPDRKTLAWRTAFEDDSPGAVKSWQAVTPLPVGLVEFFSAADVAAWTDVVVPA